MKLIELADFEVEREASVVVDVLPPQSYRSGHIPDAINLPASESDETILVALPNKSASIILYCAGPHCPLATQFGERLELLEYLNLSYFHGGLQDWIAADRPLVRELVSAEATSDPTTTRLLRIVDSLSAGQWVAGWLAMVLGCASIYWGAMRFNATALTHNDTPLTADVGGLLDCIYFSFVTATTLGYGDIVPHGWARLLAATEAMAGIIIAGALISKLLSSQQELQLREIHDLTFKERLGRVQTSLHLLISEFQDIRVACEKDQSRESVDLRFCSASTLLIRDLRVVRDLLHERHHKADETSLEAILVTLNATLQAYFDTLKSAHLQQRREAGQMARLVDEICAECVPHQYSDELKKWMDKNHLMAQRIIGYATST